MSDDHVDDDSPVRACQHTQVTHQHGTRRAYVGDRCRCTACRQANTLAARERTTAIAYGTWSGLVDAGATRAHVQKLRAAGMSLKHLAALADVGRGTLDTLIYGDPSRRLPPTARVHARTEERLLAVRVDITALSDRARIPATGSRRRLQALAVLGWSTPRLAFCTRLSQRTLRTALTAKSVSVSTAIEIGGLYDQLRGTQPPARDDDEREAALAQARRAREAGWRPPLAWDEIDTDPDDTAAEPTRPGEAVLDEIAIERAMNGEPVTLTAAECQEAVTRLTARGHSAQRICGLMNMSHRAVARMRATRSTSAA